jgi:hypothetical protein
MKRSFKAFIVAMLVAAPMLSSCADMSGPVEPEVTSTIERQDGLLGGLLGVVGGLVGGVVNLLGSVLSGPDANGNEVAKWIDSDGGTIKTAAYTLTVPRGAVRERTKFVVSPSNTGKYMVELEAFENTLLGMREVGSKGFRKPVLLTISYRNANGITNEKKIAIVYVVNPAKGEVQASDVDTRDNEVTAKLNHFSKYAMVQN